MSVLILCPPTSLVASDVVDANQTRGSQQCDTQSTREELNFELRSRHLTPLWWPYPRRSEIPEAVARYACTVDCVLLVTPAPDPLHRVVKSICKQKGHVPVMNVNETNFDVADVALRISVEVMERLGLKVTTSAPKSGSGLAKELFDLMPRLPRGIEFESMDEYALHLSLLLDLRSECTWEYRRTLNSMLQQTNVLAISTEIRPHDGSKQDVFSTSPEIVSHEQAHYGSKQDVCSTSAGQANQTNDGSKRDAAITNKSDVPSAISDNGNNNNNNPADAARNPDAANEKNNNTNETNPVAFVPILYDLYSQSTQHKMRILTSIGFPFVVRKGMGPEKCDATVARTTPNDPTRIPYSCSIAQGRSDDVAPSNTGSDIGDATVARNTRNDPTNTPRPVERATDTTGTHDITDTTHSTNALGLSSSSTETSAYVSSGVSDIHHNSDEFRNLEKGVRGATFADVVMEDESKNLTKVVRGVTAVDVMIEDKSINLEEGVRGLTVTDVLPRNVDELIQTCGADWALSLRRKQSGAQEKHGYADIESSTVTLGEYVDAVNEFGSYQGYYAANNCIPTTLISAFPPPDWPCLDQLKHTFRLHDTKLWLGSSGAGAPLHRDLQDNIVVCLFGGKRFHLAAPHFSNILAPEFVTPFLQVGRYHANKNGIVKCSILFQDNH